MLLAWLLGVFLQGPTDSPWIRGEDIHDSGPRAALGCCPHVGRSAHVAHLQWRPSLHTRGYTCVWCEARDTRPPAISTHINKQPIPSPQRFPVLPQGTWSSDLHPRRGCLGALSWPQRLLLAAVLYPAQRAPMGCAAEVRLPPGLGLSRMVLPRPPAEGSSVVTCTHFAGRARGIAGSWGRDLASLSRSSRSFPGCLGGSTCPLLLLGPAHSPHLSLPAPPSC